MLTPRRCSRPLCIATAWLAALLAQAHAAGLPDPSFGAGGAFVTQNPDASELRDALIDAEGRVVGVGSRAVGEQRRALVVRLTATGAPDATFGGDGDIELVPPPGYARSELRALVERADGRLLVAGYASPGADLVDAVALVCRLQTDGALDPEFGEEGCTTPPFGPLSPEEVVEDIALQNNGRIVLLGTSRFGPTRRPAVMRLRSEGTRDLCFDDPACETGGAVIAPDVGDPIVALNAIAIAPDQKIVLAGSAVGGGIDMAVVRLLQGGAVDAAFGNDGSRRIGFDLGGGNFDVANAVVVLPDGAIAIAGSAETGTNARYAAVAKLTASGTPDIFFGQSGPGRAVTPYTDVSFESFGTGIALQSDGRLVVSGTAFMAPNQLNGYFAAWRLMPDGFSDPDFGNFDGRIAVTLAESTAIQQLGHALEVDADHVVLVGSRQLAGNQPPLATVLRLDRNGVLRDGFE